jgi:Phage head-tail joining protein
MRIAALNRLVTIRARMQIAADKYGASQPHAGGLPIAKVYAELVESKSEEVAHGSGKITKTLLTFRVRYVAFLKPGDFLTYQGHDHDIKAITEIGRRKYLELVCEQRPA